MDYFERDEEFMRKALQEARLAYARGQLPIAALLVIDNKIIEANSNSQVISNGWGDHAENILILRQQAIIRRSAKESKLVELFSTLEPCLQCMGTIAHNRISRVIYACPDPVAGSTHINPPTEWYSKKWPKIVRGPFARESYDLFVEFMKRSPETWKNVLPTYENLSKVL